MLKAKISAIVLVMFIPATVWGQVSMELLHNGSNTLSTAPGSVQLNLEVTVSSTLDLDGLQFGLLSSNGELFAYSGNPIITHGTPFTEGEFLGQIPNEGDLLSTLPLFAYFHFVDYYSADSFPSVIMIISVTSVATLPAGTYTFRSWLLVERP
ncbi:MAG: hypothetical protein ACYTBZ_13310 [Planctomycetota bacterium]|jgi:hypothetical protein